MVKNSKKILVIHFTGRVGDTLFITPLLETISNNYKNSEITALVHRNTIALVEHSKHANYVSTISKKRARYRGWLSRNKYDIVFVSSSPDEDVDSLVSYACRVGKRIIAFETPSEKLNNCINYVVHKDFNKDRHLVDYYHDLTNAVGIPSSRKRINFNATNSELNKSKKILQNSSLKDCKIIIAVKITGLPSRSYRDWPEKNFIELTEILAKQYSDIGFIMLGGLDEYEKYDDMSQKIQAPVLNLSNQVAREVGAMMSHVSLYLGVNTGFTHLMSSFDAPMVVLFHPLVSGRQYAPVNHPNFYSLECSNCINGDESCMMASISSKQVFDTINLALSNVVK